MKWKTLEFSRSSVIKAGEFARNAHSETEDYSGALAVIDNWRAAHAYPLHVIYVNLKRMASGYPKVVVAERLKRLSSIIDKLKREPHMSLWAMQDLGGCRVIVPRLSLVRELSNKFISSRIRHKYRGEDDYIKTPKQSGYRSYHLVFQYQSDNKSSSYNRNMLVEIQFRTRLQHLWATAVETMGLVTNQALKSGRGSEEDIRFFSLVSSLFAIEENSILVPGTPNDINKLVYDIQSIDGKCHVLDRLSAYKIATYHVDKKDTKKQGYYLLNLNYSEKKLHLNFFSSGKVLNAVEKYNDLESTYDTTQVNAVLVSVPSFKALKVAYPNYFLDISAFIKKVRDYLY